MCEDAFITSQFGETKLSASYKRSIEMKLSVGTKVMHNIFISIWKKIAPALILFQTVTKLAEAIKKHITLKKWHPIQKIS